MRFILFVVSRCNRAIHLREAQFFFKLLFFYLETFDCYLITRIFKSNCARLISHMSNRDARNINRTRAISRAQRQLVVEV